MSEEEKQKKSPSLWQVTKSVLAAFFGVQSNKNYERDFTHGKPYQYVIIGLIGVAILIFILIGILRLLLP